MIELRRIDYHDRQKAVKQIADNMQAIKALLNENVKLADEFGIDFTFRDPHDGEHYYKPEKPNNVDITGTDWKESYDEYEYGEDGKLFGWTSSSDYC